MVITFTQKRKSQKYLVIVFAVLIAAIAFIYLSDFFKEEEEPLIVGESVSGTVPIIEINFQFLKSPIFKKLSEPFPDLPPAAPIEKVGRKNPFLPSGQILEE